MTFPRLGHKETWEYKIARFWSRVNTSGGPDACWPYTRGITEHGYGRLRLGGALILAHVVALEEKLGRPLKPGMKALHTCDNPPCCNPKHLYEGTQQQNVQDCLRRKRFIPGHSHKKLTKTQAAAIRVLFSRGASARSIARKFGVRSCSVRRIVYGRSHNE